VAAVDQSLTLDGADDKEISRTVSICQASRRIRGSRRATRQAKSTSTGEKYLVVRIDARRSKT
jgi:hypothetical protein